MADSYAPFNDDECAEIILRLSVRKQCISVVKKHGDFQKKRDS